MKTLIFVILIAMIVSGCATPMTKFNSPVMRVFVDPDTLNQADYTRVVHAISKTGKFKVVDRKAGYQAALNEQDRQHVNQANRFDNREKFALYAKLFGARGVVVATAECQDSTGFFANTYFKKCHQTLQILDANTSEIISSVDNVVEGKFGELGLGIGWEETAFLLADSFPKYFEGDKDTEELKNYRKIAEDSAIKTKAQILQDSE